MSKASNLIIAAASTIIAGCTPTTFPPTTDSASDVSAVIVGVENGWAGDCPGAIKDTATFNRIIAPYAGKIQVLQNQQATKYAVTEALREATESSALTIFFYSGHGGSQRFGDTGSEETDGRDEFLCLYDTYMRDNDIWNIISKSQGRILMVMDCCHSQTMFRSPAVTMRRAALRLASPRIATGFGLICWSGCPDDAYSYGSASGGEFTNALARHFDDSLTYDALWKAVKSDSRLLSQENPQQTKIGIDFGGEKAFR